MYSLSFIALIRLNTYHNGLCSLPGHVARPKADEAILACGHKTTVWGIKNSQHRFPVRHVGDVGWQDECHLLHPQVRILHLSILKLHVNTELIPCDGAMRQAVDLSKQVLNLSLLYNRKNQCSRFNVTQCKYN